MRKAKPSVVIVNATTGSFLYVDFPFAPLSLESFDTFGRKIGAARPMGGPQRIAIPRSGCLLVRFEKNECMLETP